jgi:rubrerythrin
MHEMTNKDLTEAFAGESQAHMKYMIFSDVAAKEGKKNIARLFKAIACAEQIHATNHYRTMGEIKTTPENLQAGIDGEHYEVNEMYPAYLAVSKLQEEKDATRSFHGALEAEKIHEVMYSDAKKLADKGEDIDVGKIYICSVCGYTTTNQAPEKCPICGAPKSKFIGF